MNLESLPPGYEEEKPFDAGDRADVKDARKAVERITLRRNGVVKILMSDPDGRRWIKELLNECHIYSTSFSPEPMRMAFAEGERNVGLKILATVVAAAPAEYNFSLTEEYDND